ncbi:F-box/LRR-repeat protein 18-like isoform X1 [Patiria miniata]|uniref:F-box/LRR-repeat protein 18 LRR domain-containing protein n=1 Tax=Patiria miniata TaxID=46514 RepID=A0A914AUL1_PATMI|nr:F-box/LRR-repeat protein 18-like isoform X1 [Patiria miniata]
MPNLDRLDIQGTAISLKMLMKILSSAKTLSSLSFEHRWTMHFSDFSKKALATWSQLSEINVLVKTCIECSIFESCEGLKAFSVSAIHLASESRGHLFCRCDSDLLCELRFGRQLAYLYVGQEIQTLRPKMYTHRGFDPMECMCPLCCDSWNWSFCFFNSYAECAQVLAMNAMKTCGEYTLSYFKSAVPTQTVRHLYLRTRCSDQTKEHLALMTKLSHLKTLNISACLFNHSDRYLSDMYLQFFDALVEKQIPLQHFNLNFHDPMHFHEAGSTNQLAPVLGKLTGLKSLSLPICSLSDSSQSQPAWMTSSQLPTNPEAGLSYCSPSSSKRQRVGSKTNNYIRCDSCLAEVNCAYERRKPRKDQIGGNCIYCGSNLAQIVNGTPGLESLELIGQGCRSLLMPDLQLDMKDRNLYTPCPPSTVSAVSEDTLLCISRWTNLHSLVLVGLPTVLRGHCLVPITQNCKQLRYLSIAHLGRRGQCQFLGNLCEALQHAHHLEDMRLEHDNIDSMSSLFRAIQCCQSIKRLCLISKHGSVNIVDVVRMISKCPELMVVCLICSMTATDCKHLKQDITRRFGNSRPALRLAIGKYPEYVTSGSHKECLRSMPDIHIRELIMLSSKVAVTPPSWGEWKASLTEKDNE